MKSATCPATASSSNCSPWVLYKASDAAMSGRSGTWRELADRGGIAGGGDALEACEARDAVGTLGIELVVADLAAGLPDGECFGVLLSYPGASGAIRAITARQTPANSSAGP